MSVFIRAFFSMDWIQIVPLYGFWSISKKWLKPWRMDFIIKLFQPTRFFRLSIFNNFSSTVVNGLYSNQCNFRLVILQLNNKTFRLTLAGSPVPKLFIFFLLTWCFKGLFDNFISFWASEIYIINSTFSLAYKVHLV